VTVPDLVEPLVGYRAWRLEDDGALVPWSLHGTGAWEPGVNTARCHLHTVVAGRRATRHRPPAPDCMCGLYALASCSDRRLHGCDDQIVGAIAVWGDVELHRTGFRAEHAAVVALSLPAERSRRPAAEAAAARYDVPLVDRALLEETALRYGRPVDASVFEPAPRDDRDRHNGETGLALVEHVWCRVDGSELQIGITQGFASQLGDELHLTLPPVGARVESRDPLAMLAGGSGTLIAWACAGGLVAERNEKALADPQIVRSDPLGVGWLARIGATSWPGDAGAFWWGKAGETAYTAQLAQARAGIDVFADLRAERCFAGPRISGPGDLLAELARRRQQPGFGSAAEVYAACAEPLRERIAASSSVARLGAMQTVVRYEIHGPEAEMTLVAADGRVTLACGSHTATPDLTLSMAAEVAGDYFRGRVDIARALRAGLIRSDRAPVATLRVAALLKPLFGPR
jgi:glycine cleavage system H lipoate-binding protein